MEQNACLPRAILRLTQQSSILLNKNAKRRKLLTLFENSRFSHESVWKEIENYWLTKESDNGLFIKKEMKTLLIVQIWQVNPPPKWCDKNVVKVIFNSIVDVKRRLDDRSEPVDRSHWDHGMKVGLTCWLISQ